MQKLREACYQKEWSVSHAAQRTRRGRLKIPSGFRNMEFHGGLRQSSFGDMIVVAVAGGLGWVNSEAMETAIYRSLFWKVQRLGDSWREVRDLGRVIFK